MKGFSKATKAMELKLIFETKMARCNPADILAGPKSAGVIDKFRQRNTNWWQRL